jgi:hypothetical protein
MRISSSSCIFLSLFLLFIVQPASAGFLDSIVDKTKKSVQQAIEKPIDEQVDQALKPGEQKTPSDAAAGSGEPPVKTATAEPGAANHPTSVRTMILAVVKLAPNIFAALSETGQKEYLVTLFPEEGEIRSNKFYWHKKKDELIQRAVAESQNAATMFEVAPWIDNSTHVGQAGMERPNHLRFLFGQYNFDREGFPIFIQKVTIPWTRIIGNKKAPVSYRIVGVGTKKEYWLPMPVSEAETFYERFGTSRLWAHYKFRLTNVITAEDGERHPEYKKYEREIKMGGVVAERALANMQPVIDVVIEDNRLDLYALDKAIDNDTPVIPKGDLHFVTTVHLEGD